MALAADKDGLPISYNLYRGNQGESPTMIPFIEELKKTYGVENLIVVADKGLNNTANIHCLLELSNSYVLSSKTETRPRRSRKPHWIRQEESKELWQTVTASSQRHGSKK